MAPYDKSPGQRPTAKMAIGLEPDVHFYRQIESELPFLRRVVRRWHRAQADADDLVQNTVLQALSNAHLWQPGSNLRGWLFTIMRNEFLAAAAKSRRAETLRTLFTTAATIALSVPEARLEVRDVERALHRLPSCQQTALRLIVLEGVSYEEAASRMDMSVAAFRCHLSRARQRLKMTVDDRCTVRHKSSDLRVRAKAAQAFTLRPIGDAQIGNAHDSSSRRQALSPALLPV